MSSRWPAALLLLAAACAQHATAPNESDPTEAEHPAASAAAPRPFDLVAVVTSHQAKVVSSEVEGRVEKLYVHNGQLVRAGDPIAQLDASDLQSKLDQVKAERASAQAEASRAYVTATNARRKALNEQRLMRLGASAPEAYRSAQAEASASAAEGGIAEGKIHEAAASIAELEKQIAEANVVAPIDGQVSMVKAKEGEVARKGTPIARVFDPHDLVIKFAVPHDALPLVKVGQDVQVAIGTHVLVARVRASLSEYDPTLGFTPFEATFDASKLPPDVQVGDAGHVHLQGVAL